MGGSPTGGKGSKKGDLAGELTSRRIRAGRKPKSVEGVSENPGGTVYRRKKTWKF